MTTKFRPQAGRYPTIIYLMQYSTIKMTKYHTSASRHRIADRRTRVATTVAKGTWGRDVLWLAGAAGACTVAALVFTPLRMPLGWDEITYIAQTSAHVSPILMPPAHNRGVGLLAAPITIFTTSVVILRVWMALLTGVGLFGALLSWRSLRPVRELVVAGVLVGSTAAMQISVTEVTPNIWIAISALAVTGLALQAASGRMRPAVAAPLIAVTAFFLFLVRYQDAIFVMTPLAVALVIVPAWRNRTVFIALATGIGAGVVEWCAEAYLFYGNPIARWQAGEQAPKPGLYFALPRQLRTIDGPSYCSSNASYCAQWRYPGLELWWLTFAALAVVGFVVSRDVQRRIMAVVIAIGATELLAYGLLVPYSSPRYLLPTLTMMAIPAAAGIWRLPAITRWRLPAASAAAMFIIVGAVSQNFVVRSELKGAELGSHLFLQQADQIHRLGVRPPCSVAGAATPIAYYLGCSIWTGAPSEPQVVMPPDHAPAGHGWRKIWLSGLNHVPAYVRTPGRPPEPPKSLAGPSGSHPQNTLLSRSVTYPSS